MRCVPVVSYLRATWRLLFCFEGVSYAGVSHTTSMSPSPKELKSTKFSRYTVTLSIYRWIVVKKAKVVFPASDWFIKWREARSTLNDFCESSNLGKKSWISWFKFDFWQALLFVLLLEPAVHVCQCVCVWFLLVIYFSSRFQCFVLKKSWSSSDYLPPCKVTARKITNRCPVAQSVFPESPNPP